MSDASTDGMRHFASPRMMLVFVVGVQRRGTNMMSWITRKWVYGDPEEPEINGQIIRRRHYGTEGLPSPVFFHYDDNLGSDPLPHSRR